MIRIGIICPSEIALRRFLPALSQLQEFTYAGIAVANTDEWPGASEEVLRKEKEKTNDFTRQYGGKVFNSYKEIILSENIDAIYLPLPPALHHYWAKQALLAGKHILVEKPATTRLNDTSELISLAGKQNLAVHENYMFAFHDQLEAVDRIILSGELGEVRLFRISFGFPRRSANDFRYNKALGGGALLDAGGYTLKYASKLLGETARIAYSQLNYSPDFEVDISGSAALVNEKGVTVQIAFGMDNSYKCDLEVWGSNGTLQTGRILTAPAGFEPEASITTTSGNRIQKLPADDAFKKSIKHFYQCINNHAAREENYNTITRQALLIEQFIEQLKVK